MIIKIFIDKFELEKYVGIIKHSFYGIVCKV